MIWDVGTTPYHWFLTDAIVSVMHRSRVQSKVKGQSAGCGREVRAGTGVGSGGCAGRLLR